MTFKNIYFRSWKRQQWEREGQILNKLSPLILCLAQIFKVPALKIPEVVDSPFLLFILKSLHLTDLSLSVPGAELSVY